MSFLPTDRIETVVLQDEIEYKHPKSPPPVLHLDDPAGEAMLDLSHVQALTTVQSMLISEALKEMTLCNTHILLVTDASDHVKGVISAEDILGDKALKIAKENDLHFSEITVDMVMTPTEYLIAFNENDLRFAKIKHLVNTLNHYSVHHAVVVSFMENTQVIKGLFSMHTIGKALGHDVMAALKAEVSVLDIK